MIWPDFAFCIQECVSTKPDWEWRTVLYGERYRLMLTFFLSRRPRLYLFRQDLERELYTEPFPTVDAAIAHAAWIRENLPSFLMEMAL